MRVQPHVVITLLSKITDVLKETTSRHIDFKSNWVLLDPFTQSYRATLQLPEMEINGCIIAASTLVLESNNNLLNIELIWKAGHCSINVILGCEDGVIKSRKRNNGFHDFHNDLLDLAMVTARQIIRSRIFAKKFSAPQHPRPFKIIKQPESRPRIINAVSSDHFVPVYFKTPVSRDGDTVGSKDTLTLLERLNVLTEALTSLVKDVAQERQKQSTENKPKE